MYSPIFSQSSIDSFSQLTTSYTNLIFKVVQQNFEQAEFLREKLLESAQAVLPKVSNGSEIEQLRHQVKELEELKEQVEELNRKYAVLENKTRSGRWNKTGSGHFRTT